MNRTAWLAEYCLWLRACTANLRSLGVANFFMTWPQRHQMAVSKRAPPKSTAVGGPEEQLVIYCWKTVDLSKRNDSTHKKIDYSDTSKKHGNFTSKNGWLPKPPIDSPRKVEHSHLTQRSNAQESHLAEPKWGQEGKQKRCEKGGGQLGTSLGASRDLRSFSRISKQWSDFAGEVAGMHVSKSASGIQFQVFKIVKSNPLVFPQVLDGSYVSSDSVIWQPCADWTRWCQITLDVLE